MCTGNNVQQNNTLKSNSDIVCKEPQILQVDGNVTGIDSSDIESNISDDLDEPDDVFDTEDEVDNEPIPANLEPLPGQHLPPHHPVVLDVIDKDDQLLPLPLCLMLKARSVFNKKDNLSATFYHWSISRAYIRNVGEKRQQTG